jgi:hypothetical protein
VILGGFVGNPEVIQKRASEKFKHGPQADFGPTSTSAIKCRIRSAVTQAEAAIATSLHR